MVLYEPTFFSLIDAESPAPNVADGIRHAVQLTGNALDEGDPYAAAKHFIDYWMGLQSWDKTPAAIQTLIAASIVNVRRWGNALFKEPTTLTRLGDLAIPVLYMVGKLTTESAIGVARLLTAVLPRVELMEFDGRGHMGPVTHPKLVNDAIADFLDKNNIPTGS
jgi:pimeloyl-ACP methyl ester carboxylesterase